MANAHAHEIKSPGPLQGTAGLNTVFLVLSVIGAAAFIVAVKSDPTRAWSSFVLNHFYFMGIALSGMFFAAIQWLTSAMWSSPVRRMIESLGAYLPFSLVTTAILYFGIHTLFHWSHPEAVAHDLMLQGKAGYMNISFFMIRNLVGLGILMLLSWKMLKNSLAQDKDPSFSWTQRNKTLSPGFILLYAIIFSMAAFDQMMSLDSHWYSTMFGVYCFAGAFYAQLALTTLMTLHFRAKGQLGNAVNDNHVHDLGKFLFGMAIFWAYIAFSQFMLIWYANIPEETGWFMARMHGAWFYVAVFLVVGKFCVPFFVLLPRDAKRSVATLTGVSLFMMVAHWIDLLWVVQPNFYAEGPKVGWIEIGVTLGFIGAFGLFVVRFLSRHNMVAIGDPRLEEAVFHHHQ